MLFDILVKRRKGLTLPFLSSSAEGMAPIRSNSEALLTTGSFCILYIAGHLCTTRHVDEHIRGHGDYFFGFEVICDELKHHLSNRIECDCVSSSYLHLIWVASDDYVVVSGTHTAIAQLLALLHITVSENVIRSVTWRRTHGHSRTQAPSGMVWAPCQRLSCQWPDRDSQRPTDTSQTLF